METVIAASSPGRCPHWNLGMLVFALQAGQTLDHGTSHYSIEIPMRKVLLQQALNLSRFKA